MPKPKECLQLDHEGGPTPCFVVLEGPCNSEQCEVGTYLKGKGLDPAEMEAKVLLILLHTHCRLSDLHPELSWGEREMLKEAFAAVE